jgi:ubiquinone/menaquinone biosynthesis C-methylase UbiE
MDRLRSERDFHDAQARSRAATFDQSPDRLRFTDDEYLDHETWLRYAFGQLGDVAGRDVLDVGCGHGMAAVVLGRAGAKVTALELSHAYLAEARRRAEANGVRIDFVQADAERLPFGDASFDRIWGHAVLHHLDVPTAARELQRVLRPAGVTVFCEPWGENPLLTMARHSLPYPGKGRTSDERPLTQRHVRLLKQVFPCVDQRGFDLLGMLRRALPYRGVVKTLQKVDDWFLHRWRGLQRMCRYVVLTVRH